MFIAGNVHVEALFDSATSTLSYLVMDRTTAQCAVIDSVLAGATWEATAKTTGSVKLGQQKKNFDLGSKADADAVLPPAQRHMPHGVAWSREQLEALPGLCLHDLMRLPIERLASKPTHTAPSSCGV